MTAQDILSPVRPCIKCGAMDRRPNGSCRACALITKAAYRKANKKKTKAANKAYREANPEKIKAIDIAWYTANRGVKNANNRAWRAANKEAHKECVYAWNKENPGKLKVYKANRRARLTGGDGRLSPEISGLLFKLQKGMCPCCKQPLGDSYHMDHIMPLALGGPNIDSNMQLLRSTCNQQKHAKHPVKFMQERGFLL